MRSEPRTCVLPFPTEEAILSRFYQEGHPTTKTYHKNTIRKLETERYLESRQSMKDAYTNAIWAIKIQYDL